MLQTSTTTYQTGLPLRLLELPEAVDIRSDEHVAVRRERQTEVAMDDTLAASFPASDPPAWNPVLWNDLAAIGEKLPRRSKSAP